MDDSPPDPATDAAVEAVIAEFGGDPRAAVRALLHDIDALARDYNASVSRGFVRREKAGFAKTSCVLLIRSGEQSPAVKAGVSASGKPV